MKIESLGYLSFLLSFDHLNMLTDPLSLEDIGLKVPKKKTDAVIYSKNLDEKSMEKAESLFTPSRKDRVLHIKAPGEYELGGLMIRRGIDSNVYILDEDDLRILYIGYISKEVKVDDFKNLGDVDVLIIPVGDGANFPEFGDVVKIVNKVDPLVLIPSGYKTDDMKAGGDLKTVQEFLKQAGYTNVRYEKSINVSGGVDKEVRNMDVVILE